MRSAINAWVRRIAPNGADAPLVTRVRGIRGAATIEIDSPADIRCAVASLVAEIEARNGIEPGEIISAIFTTTADIRSMFPAQAARDAGWNDVPLMYAAEINVPGSLPLCIRVLVHVELPVDRVVQHVYLGAAVSLRPDRARS